MNKTIRVWLAVPCMMGVLGLGAATSAFAQQSRLVNVNVSNVANNLAQNLKVNVSQIPVTVQAPIGVAANVCNISVNVLAKQAQSGQAECTAHSTNRALTQIVQRQLQTQ